MRTAGLVDDPVIDPTTMGAATGMGGFIGLFVVLFIGAAIFSAVVGIRKYRILRDAGTDPFTVDAAVAAKVLRSDVLRGSDEPATAPRSIEERLAELDGLLARGVITADEHREARAAVLRG
ncbi:SHOCT domain-containing protein [Microbacterium sp. T2.11-28]|uniref:SHOCT domain-containing protein n=1 Tax=unclassified Microbacterium TaxID=2609290 RepID=UPI002477C24D|nr:SHOCT domain-containing protein [Microbacterium sp. T2.11-28]CAI9386682.1 hypothetical protein MICABA_00524 [Microbacterium sp. T2.11-28]